MDKKIRMSILSIFVAAALVGSIVAISGISTQAFAGGDDHDDDKKKSHGDGHKKNQSNEALQDLSQSTTTGQDSSCGSGNDTTASCNNVALSFNLNDGSNALGQE